jgi:hypothetical protein
MPDSAPPEMPSLPARLQFLRLVRLGPCSDTSQNTLLLQLLDLPAEDVDGEDTDRAVDALSLVERSLTGQLEAFLAGHLALAQSHRLYERETICSVRPQELVFHRLVALLPEGVTEAEEYLPVEALTPHPYRILRARLPRPFDRRRRRPAGVRTAAFPQRTPVSEAAP